MIVEILQLRAKFQTAMASCSWFIWTTISNDHWRVWTANLLHNKQLPDPQGHMALWPSGLGNYLICKRFAVQTLLWSLEFVIQINLKHDTITVNWLCKHMKNIRSSQPCISMNFCNEFSKGQVFYPVSIVNKLTELNERDNTKAFVHRCSLVQLLWKISKFRRKTSTKAFI